ncbi:DUF927 domain-containing protein [Streptomyces albidoflavus]|uniref:DUF927 domain-containing protein n=1 Tax=Streptomyces albidoflavus TaxID=1886 RepID=UPI00332384CB
MTHQSTETPPTDDGDVPSQRRRGAVSNLERGGTPAGCRPIAGMKRGWFYREADRMVLHRQNPEDTPLPIGQVPEVVSTITHLTDDGEDIRTEYLVKGKRQRRARILTEDELDRGTWAAKTGSRRPTGNDEKHAFARLIREEADKAPVVPARTYYNEAGDLVFPDADAQTLGYRVLRGEEEAARDAWQEIGAWMFGCGKSALVTGAMFAGPVLDSLDVLAHMINCHGPGQQGKSTILTVACACFGDLKPRRQQLMITWNSSKQGITQSLRQRGFLPLGLDEHSSSGRRIQESSREISQMVAGAVRAMGTADGAPRESDGFWCSCAVSSSNEPLKHEGQTEDLATRLQEFQAPFFPNVLVLADGATAPEGHMGAEHVSKRLKRLAKGHGGWPLEWAIRRGMFRADNLGQLKKLHLELCAKYRPAQGGIAATIAELHMAWVVGAHMFAEAIGVPGLGLTAEEEAAQRLAVAIEQAAEANVPDHEKLWSALDSLRIEASAFPEMDKVGTVAEEGFRKVRGFHRSDAAEWWVIDPVVRQAATEAGIDNLTAALRALADLKVHVRGDGKHAQRQTPKELRRDFPSVPRRMHCFSTLRAGELFAPEGEEDGPGGAGGGQFPSGPTPGTHPGPTGVGPENGPLTSGGPTGPTGPTLELFTIPQEGAQEDGPAPAEEATASRAHDVATVTAVFPSAVAAVTDQEWAELAAKAKGRTASALRFGVLGNGRLFLPNCEPVHVPLPGHVDQVPALMAAYGLKTLYVHEEALAPMGLPNLQERQALGIEQERAARGLDPKEYVRRPGAQTPVAHPWATPTEGGPVTEMRSEAALSSWMTLVLADGKRLSVSVPAWEDRIKKARSTRLGGLGGPETPDVLLDALMVWTLSTRHGRDASPDVHPYYGGPNKTGEDFAGGLTRPDVASEAIRRRMVPPADPAHEDCVNWAMVPQIWERPLSEFTPEQRAAAWIQEYDKTAAWLPAYSNVQLGVGEPTHRTDGTITYDKRFAGYWRLAEIPGTVALPGLPPLVFKEAQEGGYWVATPSMDLLKWLWPNWEPQILEAWVWEHSKRALEGFYRKVKDSRVYIVAAAEAGRPGAKFAKQINGAVYQSFRGYLGRSKGPRLDHATGEPYAKDIYWRPDWAFMLLSHATANMYRNLVDFAREEGVTPLYVNVDAAGFASDQADPELAKPDGMRLGSQGGQWTAENTVPMADFLPLFEKVREDHKVFIHNAIEQYTAERGE